MQQTLDQVRNQLWDRLQPFFDRHVEADGEVKNERLEELLRDTFENSSQQDINYVVKNMHRLDTDNNGTVSFPQYANFLFKMHTGEMSLQRRHLKGLMKRGSERLMSYDEFQILINDAVKFINVKIPKQTCTNIFKQTDKNKDGFITYVEYFHAISEYICKSEAVLEKEKNSPVKLPSRKPIVTSTQVLEKEWKRSLLREFIWIQLRKLYFHFSLGKGILYSDLRALIISICGQLRQQEITFILTGLFDLNGQYVEFVPFAIRFIYLIAEVGLARFTRSYQRGLRTLTLQQFVILFKNTYKFLSSYQISVKFLQLVYGSINGKGSITFAEYLEWIREFLAAEHWDGSRYAFLEDNPEGENSLALFYTQLERPSIRPSRTQIGKHQVIKFNFSDYSMAYRVRQRVMYLLIQFDKDKDEEFSEQQIRQALVQLLKEDPIELDYVTKNVFRYDRDGDKHITYDELTNFAVQWHFGEMAIQRLHRKKFYNKGAERIMNKDEFGRTLNYALDFIQMQAQQKQIDLLFSEVDLDHDGWISYEVYFLFLKYYLGSMSVAYLKPQVEPKKPLSIQEQLLKQLKGLGYFERFIKLLFEQLRLIFIKYDDNENMVFEPNEIEAILINVFNFSQREIQYIMFEIFRIDAKFEDNISFQNLCAIILDIFFVNIWLMRRYQDFGKHGWMLRKINCPQFVTLITEACYFVSVKPFEDDLKNIFADLDTDKDGFITLAQYIDFIRKNIGRDFAIKDLPSSPQKPQKVESKPIAVQNKEIQENFVGDIWGELKRLFDLYDKDKKGYLVEEEFKAFAVEVLNEKSENQLKYIFWNMFRLDENLDMKIQFQQFAPYVLKHAGQIALQRFHLNQTRGKNSLTEDELFIVISNAYSFLKTMPKSRPIVSLVFKRISRDGGVRYSNYLQWIGSAIARRFK